MIKRKLFDKILKEKDNNKIVIILGPRQVGKTTILKEAFDKIGKNSLFLDLDILENFEKASSYSKLITTLKLNGYQEEQKELFYLFLDEFQRYEDLSIIMKNVYDNNKNIKIYASGSSSLKIMEQVQESLAGRKKIFHLYPLDFEEFLWFKNNNEAISQFNNISKLDGEELDLGRLRELLEEYLIYGGYPEVVLSDNKKEALRSIFDLYVKKELVNYLKLEKLLGIKNLIEYLAINHGQKIKYEEAAERCTLKQYEVKEYIEILKETFLIRIVRPFFTNKNKELIKIPKIYFLDNGVRNYFINNFNSIKKRADSGFLFESFVLQELIKSEHESIKFWQDKNLHEVDFIIDLISKQIPVEVKFKDRLKQDDLIGLRLFEEEYKANKAYLVNLGIQKVRGRINFKLPFNIRV